MKSMLSRSQFLAILLLAILLHILLLFAMLIVKLNQESSKKDPVIMFEDQKPLPRSQEQDWVAANNSVPLTQMNFNAANQSSEQESLQEHTLPEQMQPTLDAQEIAEQEQPIDEKQAKQQKIEEHNLDDAVALASNLLEQDKVEEKVKEEKQNEVKEQVESKQTRFELKAAPEKQKFTFAQLAQGFAQHMAQVSPMRVASNNQGQASADQFKHLHYCQKIIGCIVNSYKINRGALPHNKSLGAARILLTLNENGTIHTLSLVHSSGNNPLDQFLLNVFKDASSSFPPVPSSFKQQPYQLPIFNIDRLEGLESTQGWYIDNRMS